MTLHYTVIGDGAQPVVFLHGLYGQGRNFTTVAHGISDLATCYLVDLPNHGRSPWTVTFTLDNQADEVAAWLRQTIEPPVALIGHSLGGKIAMRLALRYPDLVSRLMVVDISPAETARALTMAPLVTAMRSLQLDQLRQRKDADDAMREDVPDDVVRAFLLQNLRRQGDSWHWQANLDLLGDNLAEISGWVPLDARFDGPVYWVAGAESTYVQPEHNAPMRRYFPHTAMVKLKGAGHWVHADAPGAFIQLARSFLDSADS